MNRGKESIFNMRDIKLSGHSRQLNYITPRRDRDIILTYIRIGSHYYTADFSIIHRLFRREQTIFSSRFHFHKDNQAIGGRGNNIQFIMMPPPIFMQYAVSFPFEEPLSLRFAFLSCDIRFIYPIHQHKYTEFLCLFAHHTYFCNNETDA